MSAVEPCHDHPAEILGRYHLGPVLRRSPGCCSHRAVDRLLRRTVSVTMIDRAGSQDLTLPGQSWLDRSSETAEVYDGGSWRGRTFLVTQHPEARTLAETTPPAGLDVAEVRELGLAVAGALVPLHRRGRSHGGLGPGTVAFSERGAALSDVGLLPWLAQWSDLRLDPPYPAPGSGSAPAADVYALGRLLAELGPPRVPAALRALLDAMTAASPAARPTVEDVLERLRTLPVRSRRRGGAAAARGRRAVVVAAAALLLAGGAGLGALVNASGAGSAAAYAAAVGSTPVPGLPLPPAVATVPPLPEPAPEPVPQPVPQPIPEPVEAAAPRAAEPVGSQETSDGAGGHAAEARAARLEHRSDSDGPESRVRTDSDHDDQASDDSASGDSASDDSASDDSASDDSASDDRTRSGDSDRRDAPGSAGERPDHSVGHRAVRLLDRVSESLSDHARTHRDQDDDSA
ncbi:hypothetical protein [Actinomycetospora sp. NBRC 106378]|uniref:hypothetical protein n=1 Tax=Actinomycetospora sp. NBRC 106378 TaxID=3032208 RepID=UPI0024A5C30E|nr:hypothetical protein [Actinomycetospora sp. NBRC 106378]GLZ55774.1 hypothetical protein Acsp07_53910 [Actinomycetospora sp. NBRC 106378]